MPSRLKVCATAALQQTRGLTRGLRYALQSAGGAKLWDPGTVLGPCKLRIWATLLASLHSDCLSGHRGINF